MGNQHEILEKSNGVEPIEWAKQQVEILNKQHLEMNTPVLIPKFPSKIIQKDNQTLFNCEYLFSKKLYCELSKKYIEQPNFELHNIYHALEVIFKEYDTIQSEVYKNNL